MISPSARRTVRRFGGLTQLSQGRIEPLLMEEGYQPWKETEE